VFGVCTDDAVDDARKTSAKHEMTWPCWFDGSNGPIARNLDVLRWPTIYLLDHHGRIAVKNTRGKALDAKIAELMKDVADSRDETPLFSSDRKAKP
jgi:hypothetical protein